MNHLRNPKIITVKCAVSVLLISICCQFGCQPKQPFYLTEKGRFQNHYIGNATQIEYPNVDVQSLSEVCLAAPPLTLSNPDPTAMWDLTLEEAIQMALKNSTIIRTLSGVGFSQMGVSGAPGMLLQAPASIRTVYDPALIESDPRAGQEAALAAFDAQLTAATRWTQTDEPIYFGNGTVGAQNNTGQVSLGITKYSPTGTQFSLSHVDQYERYGMRTGTPSWSSYLEGGFRHQLGRGGGIEYNRIAGRSDTPGMYGGVAIARISTDMSLNDFEMATRNLVADVEKTYWYLYYAYHRLESVRSGRDAAHRTWQQTKNRYDHEARGGSAQNKAQAEINYFTFRQQTELAQDNLLKAEGAMRYIIGLTPADGRLIRPIDDPITAPIRLDWQNIMCEALYRSPELRKQKWEVKRRELELIASKNFLKPRLDLEGGYRIAGAGKDLLSSNKNNAYSSLATGDYAGWSVGFSASAPLGWRQELAGVRNAELQLTKARKLLQEQELELSHQLSDSFRAIDSAYQQMQTTLACYRAADDEVQAVRIAYEQQAATLDLLLQAQRRQSEAQTGYHSSVVDYNLAIMTLHYRKGSLLEYNNVCLTEGPWPGKAYFDAKRRAKERDAGHYFNYGFTKPRDVSRGTYQQHQHDYNSMEYEQLPKALPRGEHLIPPPPGGNLRTIETDTSSRIPTPMLPAPEKAMPVSLTVPNEEPPSLTPVRNRRYVEEM
jgi:outer membrane protein TolC